MGVDPEILAIGTEMAVYHIEKGALKWHDWVIHFTAKGVLRGAFLQRGGRREQ